MGRVRHFFLQYVGNVEPREAPAERRTNRHARELVDWTKEQMEARGLSAEKKHELLHHLREALRQGVPASGGGDTSDATDEETADWLPDGKGWSRDAPG